MTDANTEHAWEELLTTLTDKLEEAEIPRMSDLPDIGYLKTLQPVSASQLQQTAKTVDGGTGEAGLMKIQIDAMLQQGTYFSTHDLTPIYLYDGRTGLFTVTTEEYINNKMH